jgi:hypothetical protein
MDKQFDPETRAKILLLALQGRDYSILNLFFSISYYDPVDNTMIDSIMDYLRTDEGLSAELLYAAAACTVARMKPENEGKEDINMFSSLYEQDQEYFGELMKKLDRDYFIELNPEFFIQLYSDYDYVWDADSDTGSDS